MDEVVVKDKVSRFGLREVHVMRMGERVEMEGWLERAQAEGGPALGVLEYEEEGLGVWHLWVWWRCDRQSKSGLPIT